MSFLRTVLETMIITRYVCTYCVLCAEELHSALWSSYLTMYLFPLKHLHVCDHTDLGQGSLSKHDNMMVD